MKMRCKVLTILMILLPLTSAGQTIRTGLVYGLNIGNWREDIGLFAENLAFIINSQTGFSNFSFESESRIGFNMGALVECQFNEVLSLQPELSYSQKGVKFSGTGTFEYEYESYSVDTDIIEQLDYVDLILLARCSLPKGNFKPYIIFGPGIGYLVSSKTKTKVTIEGESDSDSSKAEGFRKIDPHVNVGGGFEINNAVRIEFRYYHFFKPAPEESEGSWFNSIKQINLITYF